MINQWVVKKYREVRVIDQDGAQVGVMTSRQAQQLAQDAGLDLVAISETAVPCVCRIADYGKLKYDESKRKRENKKRVQETKGVKISPRIAEHDLGVYAKRTREFLEEGDKVRVVCQFRARELSHPELGQKSLARLLELVGDVATVEHHPRLEGRQMVLVLIPTKKH